MQVDPDLGKCKNNNLIGEAFNSSYLQRFVVTTFGSYAVSNVSEWGLQINEMYASGILFPVPLNRELVPILNLFQENSVKVQMTISIFIYSGDGSVSQVFFPDGGN